MKTFLKGLLFVSLLAWIPPVLGQSYSAIAEIAENYNSTKTIVRTWGDYALSYVQENGSGYLYLTKVDKMATEGNPYLITPSGNKYSLPLPDFVINDMQILQNKAYFCGTLRQKGFYGYIDLPLTFFSQFNYYTFSDTINLKKMVVYSTGSSTKLVAIGEHYTGNPIPARKDIVLEVDGIGNPLSWYSIYTLPYTSIPQKEALYDIVLTNNNVCFLGHDTQSGTSTQLFIRWASRTNISGTIQNRFDYSLPPDEINNGVLATVVDSNNWIAIAYVHAEDNHIFSTRVRLIDAMGLHYVQYSQEYSIENKIEPYEISYNSTHEVLTVLQNCTGLPLENKFRLLTPYPLFPYNFNTLHYPNLEFTSLTQFDNNHYIATGTNMARTSKFWYMQDLNSPFPSTCSCPYVSTEQARLLNSPAVSRNPINVPFTGNPLSRNSRPLSRTSANPTLNCNYSY